MCMTVRGGLAHGKPEDWAKADLPKGCPGRRVVRGLQDREWTHDCITLPGRRFHSMRTFMLTRPQDSLHLATY
jgi:hypothetical protein